MEAVYRRSDSSRLVKKVQRGSLFLSLVLFILIIGLIVGAFVVWGQLTSFPEVSREGFTTVKPKQIFEVHKGAIIIGDAFEWLDFDGKTSHQILKTPMIANETINVSTKSKAVIYYDQQLTFAENIEIQEFLNK